jgi:glyceraldehyde 3-phosphate dehydrogenase
MISVAINGFGRIGRNFLRTLMADPEAQKKISVVAINIGPSSKIENAAFLFKHDTLMGPFSGSVELHGQNLVINGKSIALIAQKDVATLPWKALHIDWVVECTGHFTHRADAQKHIDAGAKRVLISAPAQDEDCAIIPGVNEQDYNPAKDYVVSLGSCTTNAIVPIIHVLQQSLMINAACLTTVHAYTNTQVLLDVEGEDLRRSRAAALNIIPTSTGADSMITKIFPALKGKVTTTALRVPVAKVSFIDFTVSTDRHYSVAEVNDFFYKASRTKELENIVGFVTDPLVSSDFSQSNHSIDIDSLLTATTGPLLKVCGWYDNEWAYSERLKDFLVYAAGR